jgi:DNA-binding winged helix-turn-helix (wHTH) protein
MIIIVKREQDEIGFIDIPQEYSRFNTKEKRAVCNKLIDMLLTTLDRELDPVINRITFLNEVLESSIVSNEELEQYEICQCLTDIRTILNED